MKKRLVRVPDNRAWKPNDRCEVGIPINSRLCPIWLNGSVHVDSSLLERRCLFVTCAHAPTGCSSSETNDEFYRELFLLSWRVLLEYVVTDGGDFEAQLGHLAESKRVNSRPYFCSCRSNQQWWSARQSLFRSQTACDEHIGLLSKEASAHSASSFSFTALYSRSIRRRWCGPVEGCRLLSTFRGPRSSFGPRSLAST